MAIDTKMLLLLIVSWIAVKASSQSMNEDEGSGQFADISHIDMREFSTTDLIISTRTTTAQPGIHPRLMLINEAEESSGEGDDYDLNVMVTTEELTTKKAEPRTIIPFVDPLAMPSTTVEPEKTVQSHTQLFNEVTMIPTAPQNFVSPTGNSSKSPRRKLVDANVAIRQRKTKARKVKHSWRKVQTKRRNLISHDVEEGDHSKHAGDFFRSRRSHTRSTRQHRNKRSMDFSKNLRRQTSRIDSDATVTHKDLDSSLNGISDNDIIDYWHSGEHSGGKMSDVESQGIFKSSPSATGKIQVSPTATAVEEDYDDSTPGEIVPYHQHHNLHYGLSQPMMKQYGRYNIENVLMGHSKRGLPSKEAAEVRYDPKAYDFESGALATRPSTHLRSLSPLPEYSLSKTNKIPLRIVRII